MAVLVTLIRATCYVAFVIVGGATALALLIEALGLCPGFNANTGLVCGGGVVERIANVALGVVLMSLLSILPAVLAIAGLILAARGAIRRLRADAPTDPV